MRQIKKQFLLLLIVLLSCTGMQGMAESGDGAYAVELTPTSIVSFTNAVYHYVVFDCSFQNADKLVLRLYHPSGKQTTFRTGQHVRYQLDPGRSVAYSVKRTDTEKRGLDIYFRRGCDTGLWTIEITAMTNQKKVVGRGTLTVEVREPAPVVPGDYDSVRELVVFPGKSGENAAVTGGGRIRFVTQLPDDSCFVPSLWKSAAYDLTDSSRTMCTRAVLSMALSWIGIDCSPVRMSDLTRAKEIFYTYADVLKKLGNVCCVEGNLEELWECYQTDGSCSPVSVHFTYGNQGMHALLLIARDSENPTLFYALNSSEGANMSALGGKKHDHLIPLIIEEGKVGCLIQSPALLKYQGGKIDQICQWRRTD